MAALVVLAGVVTAVLLMLSRARPPAEQMAPALVPAETSQSSPAPSEGTVVVEVVGKVRAPGVISLPAGSRVVDALREAGGLRPGVRATGQNLARVIADGEQISFGTAGTPAPGAAAPATGGARTGGLVNINTATAQELDTLPGLGPVLAERIIAHRSESGPFADVTGLLDVSGIGEATFADLEPLVTTG